MIDRYRCSGALLDVGAGFGQFANLARERYEVECTEVSESAIQIARVKYGLDIRRGDVHKLDFGQRKFQVITLFHVLEHVHDPRMLLIRCRDLLSEEGVLVVAIPNELQGWKYSAKRLLATAGVPSFRNYTRGLKSIRLDIVGEEIHLSHFTMESVRSLFERCNLRIIDVDIDPSHAFCGVKQWIHEVAFQGSRFARQTLGICWGEALWIAAKKPHPELNLSGSRGHTASRVYGIL